MTAGTYDRGEADLIERHANQFPGPHLAMVLASIRAGNTEGYIRTVPQRGAPLLLMLWDGGNDVFYLAGDCADGAAVDDLANLVAEHREKQTHGCGSTRLKVRALSHSLEARLPDIFPNDILQPSPTLFMTVDSDQPLSASGPLESEPGRPGMVHGADIRPITPSVLAPGSYGGSEYVLDEILAMWPSEDRFYEVGFGIVVSVDQEIVCWCTAEYMSPTLCGIGIETLPEFRGRGVATAAAMSFLEEARRRHVAPGWECRRDNLASIRIAEKVGFVTQSEEQYWAASEQRQPHGMRGTDTA